MTSFPAILLPIAKQNLLEGCLKISVGESVAHRITSAIDVAQKVAEFVEIHVDAIGTETFYYDEDAVGRPTQDEYAKNCAERSDRFGFLEAVQSG